MSKDVAIIFLGLWIAVVPFLGFPGTWKTVIFITSGLGIVILTFLLRRDVISYVSRITSHKKRNTDVYVENGVKDKHQPENLNNTNREKVTQ